MVIFGIDIFSAGQDFSFMPPGVKRPGREPAHSLPSNPKVKNVWNYISTPQPKTSSWGGA